MPKNQKKSFNQDENIMSAVSVKCTTSHTVLNKDHPLWPIYEKHTGSDGVMWNGNLANILRLNGLIVIDTEINEMVRKMCLQKTFDSKSIVEMEDESVLDLPTEMDFKQVQINFADFVKIYQAAKAKMDEFSTEAKLTWAFNFAETEIHRRNTMGGSDVFKIINRDDLKYLLQNYGDKLSDEDIKDFMIEVVGHDMEDFFAEDLIATLMVPWIKAKADQSKATLTPRITKMVPPNLPNN